MCTHCKRLPRVCVFILGMKCGLAYIFYFENKSNTCKIMKTSRLEQGRYYSVNAIQI